MTLDEIVLALLARRPATGYGLKKWLSTDGLAIRASTDQSQIYRSLRRLERGGLVGFRVVAGVAGPDAKRYEVTAAGADRLRAVSREPYIPPLRWEEPAFAAWMTLLAPIEPAAALAVIDRETALRRAQLAALERSDRHVRPSADDVAADAVPPGPLDRDPRLVTEAWAAVVERRRESLCTLVDWLGRLRVRWAAALQAGTVPAAIVPSPTEPAAAG